MSARNIGSRVAALAPLFGPGRFVMVRLVGRLKGQSAEATAVYLGSGANLPFLRRYFFDDADAEMLGERYSPLWPGQREGLASADVRIRELPPVWGRVFPVASGVLRVPAWVRQDLELLPPQHGMAWPVPRRAAREVDRHLRRQGWTLVLGTAARDLERFYSDFYAPYIAARHGADAVVVPWHEFRALAGGHPVAWLRQGDRSVAGMVLLQQRDGLRFGWFGAASCPPPAGASEVLDALVLRYALKQGLHRVSLGNARPCVADGVFRYKRRLGAVTRPCPFPQATLEIDVPSGHPGVQACLTERPLITWHHGYLRVVEAGEATAQPPGLRQVPHGDAG